MCPPEIFFKKFFHHVVISSWQAAVIIYYSEDTYNITGTVVVNISVTNAPRGGQPSDYCMFSANQNRVPVTYSVYKFLCTFRLPCRFDVCDIPAKQHSN